MYYWIGSVKREVTAEVAIRIPKEEVLFIPKFFFMVGVVAMIGIGRKFVLSRTLGLVRQSRSCVQLVHFMFLMRTRGLTELSTRIIL